MTRFERAGSDLLLGVQTPEGIGFALYPAGLLARGCAWAIDAVIEWALLIGLNIVVYVFRGVLGIWFLLIMRFVLNWFYHAAFEIFCRGQSPGKRIMGIRVVRADGSPVNPGASFLRNLLRFADGFMFLYLIALACMAASSGFRRLGDWVGDTLVVYVAQTHAHGRLASPAFRRSDMVWLAVFPKVSPPGKLGYEEKQAILAFARRYPLLGKARADEIAETWIGKLKDASNNSGSELLDTKESVSASDYILGIAHTLGG